jgi:hypothetical protein
MPNFSFPKTILKRALFLFIPFLQACRMPSSAQELAVTDQMSGIRLQVVQEDTLPALKILLPRQPSSDPGILALLPEHVTAREHGKT